MFRYLITIFLGTFISNLNADNISKTDELMLIDGIASETIWSHSNWFLINQPIIGPLPESSDFSGRYKLAWDKNYLYILAEITDDVLFDGHPDPIENYWDDDCLEIFIDEDASGGNHQFNFNAFAYHLALDNQVVDIGEKKHNGKPDFLVLNEHAINRWRRSSNEPSKIIWEVALSVYDDKYSANISKKLNKPVLLSNNKTMGFMLAYCDNDGSTHRENFVGSKAIEPVNGDKNRGYIDANVFGKIRLVERKE